MHRYARCPPPPPIADPFFQFPASRVYEDLRATSARPVNSRREGAGGMVKNGVNLEYVRYADIVGNLVVTYRGRLKNSGARNSTRR